MDKKNEAVVQRYVDILTNGGFKALFGDVNNKDVVISILNVLDYLHRLSADGAAGAGGGSEQGVSL